MKLSENQIKALDYISKHPEGIIADEMKHLFEGDEKRARGVAYQLWKKRKIRKEPFIHKEKRATFGTMTFKRQRYFPIQEVSDE